MKRILLLGGKGFIGRNLTEYIQRFPEEYALTVPTHEELNLTGEEAVVRFLGKEYYDIVIHAAVCNPRRLSPGETYNELNSDLRMYFNFDNHSSMFGKMLYFGSGAEYDKSAPICQVKETDDVNGIPKNDYGLAKFIIGRQIEKSSNVYNMRIFGLYGKYENWRTTFISGACCKAIKHLPITIRRNVFFDYLYIDDFCRIIKHFIDNDPKYHTYNITSGKRVDLVSIAELVKKVSGENVPIYVCTEGLANEYTADNSRMLNEIGDFGFTDMERAVASLLDYYRSIYQQINTMDLLYQ